MASGRDFASSWTLSPQKEQVALKMLNLEW
jgi:hypothetical protein